MFDDLEDPEEIDQRDRFQEYYKELGLTPNNPVNTLKELEDRGLIEITLKESERSAPPFLCEVWAKTLSFFPEKSYYGKDKGSKKKEAKVFAFLRICNQIYLPYHMQDIRIPINHPDIKKLYFK